MTQTRNLMRLDINRALVALISLAALAASACGTGPGTGTGPITPVPASPEPNALQVVASTTVLADLVANVGGTKVDVQSLVPKGGEVHTFDPTPSDLARVAEADLIFMNGLGLDEWLAPMVDDSGGDAPVVELGEDLPGVTYLEADDVDQATDGHGHGSINPHLWLDVANAVRYVERITGALAVADPADAAAYEARGAAYTASLEDLDGWIRDQFDTVPAANRRIVSFHEAFPYYAAAYGLEVVGTIVDAPGQDPSAGEIADLVEAIKTSGARAIFTEAQFSPELAETVAAETGVSIVSDLYNDSLGNTPVDSYEAMMRWNTEKTVEALQ
jgi:ABC-type Zn uptake system ZnuABC Zn-binding protein ZnuA